jgi:hypothetical protein
MPAPFAPVPAPAVVRSLAAELFVLGFPLVLMDAMRRAHPLAATRFHRLPLDPVALGGGLAERDVRTVQSSAMIDLTAGPAMLHLPDVRGRYFSLTLIDTAGEAFASLGSRTGEPGASGVALVGPNWRGEIKHGFQARRAPSDTVWAVSRITANSVTDIPAVQELAAHQCAVPLLAPLLSVDPAAMPNLEPMVFPLAQQVAELSPQIFLHRLVILTDRARKALRDELQPLVAARLASLGGVEAIGAWAEDLRQALSHGFEDGAAAIVAAARASVRSDVSGWTSPEVNQATTPLGRAARAYAHLGAPVAEDILTLNCATDESGRPLRGEERYRIQFAPGGLPPVKAVWRLAALPLTARGETGHPPVHGAVTEHSDLLFNPDNSLEMMILADEPEGRGVNWLQSPAGTFQLLIRLYWPSPAALSGAWRMPPVERLGSRFARRPGNRSALPKLTKPHRAPGGPAGMGVLRSRA